MDLVTPTEFRLELNPDIIAVLESIADKEGLVREQVAQEAIALWVEHYRKFGPAFSRNEPE